MLTNNVVDNLVRLLESWGPNGERWCRGLTTYDNSKFCVLGGIGKLETGRPTYPMTLEGHKIALAIGGECEIMYYNDHSAHDFRDIRSYICRAIHKELAKEEAELDG